MSTFEEQVQAIEAANTGEALDLSAQSKPDEKLEAQETANPEPVKADPSEPDQEPLELTDGDEAVPVPEGEEGGEEDHSEGDRRRSKPAKQRIAELTAKLRETERQLEAMKAPEQVADAELPARPDPKDFTYGDADPDYTQQLIKWTVENTVAERRQAEAIQQQRDAQMARIQAGVAKAEAEAQDKYSDFDQRIADAVEARGGTQLPPVLTIGISTSPVGGDLLYRIATDDAVSDRLESLAGNPKALAMAIGEVEGEYLSDMDDADLDMADDMEMARLMGRMKARLRGAKAPQPAKPEIVVTNAPEPPANRARGGAGKVAVDPATDDIHAFMKAYGSGMGT